MPIYNYRCPNGHLTEELRSLKNRHQGIVCSECGEDARMEVGAPKFAVGKMGTDPDFPTFSDQWAKRQRSKASGKMKDSNNKQASDATLASVGLL